MLCKNDRSETKRLLKHQQNDLEVRTISKLEQILVAKRIVFEKIVIMPKGQQRKIKGAICNVPVKCDQTCNHALLIDLVLSC